MVERSKAPIKSRTRYRAAVLSRTLAAATGGYVLAAAGSMLMAQIMVIWLGVARTSAVTGATMLAFLIHLVAVLWAFACANAWRAWLGVGIPALVAGLLAWLLAPAKDMVL